MPAKKAKNPDLTKEEARRLLLERDELDRSRETSPLKIVEDAWVLDTSELSIEEVIDKIVSEVEKRR